MSIFFNIGRRTDTIAIVATYHIGIRINQIWYSYHYQTPTSSTQWCQYKFRNKTSIRVSYVFPPAYEYQLLPISKA